MKKLPAFKLQTLESRRAALLAFDAARASGSPNRAAAAATGISYVTAWRWRRALAAHGVEGLARGKSTGRRPLFVRLGLVRATLDLLQSHRLAPGCNSGRQAIRRVLKDPKCPAEQRRKLAPYARAQRPLPYCFTRLLRVDRRHRVELRCGRHTRLLEAWA